MMEQQGPPSIRVQPPGGQGGSPQGPQGQGGGAEQKPIEILRGMIELAQAYLQTEPDDIDKGTMAKVLAQLQAYLAKDQQDAEKAMGVTPQARFLRKANQG